MGISEHGLHRDFKFHNLNFKIGMRQASSPFLPLLAASSFARGFGGERGEGSYFFCFVTQGGAHSSLLRQKHSGGQALTLGYCQATPDGVL